MTILESVSGTTVNTVVIADAAGNVWSFVPSATRGNQVTKNGVTDTSTANVVELIYENHVVYQKNKSGNWYYHAKGWVKTVDPTVPMGPAPSASGATLTAASGSLIDAALNVWTLVASASSGLQIALNGVVNPVTANVTLLLYYNGVIYQQNSAGGWWDYVSAAWQSSADPRPVVTPPVTPPPATGHFSVSGGQIVGPTGQPFVGKGLNIYDDNIRAGDGLTYQNVLALFPGISLVRLACQCGWVGGGTSPYGSYASIAQIDAFVAGMTGNKVVVIIEDHYQAQGILSASQLATSNAWYAYMAKNYANNPYVWYGTVNEPVDTANEAVVSTQEQAAYAAVRGAGATAPILMETIGGYLWTGLTPSVYQAMTNIVWDVHFYGWIGPSNGTQAQMTSALNAQLAIPNGSAWTSADGRVPVIIGEFGLEVPNGNNGPAAVAAVLAQSTCGWTAWAWSGGSPDFMYNGTPMNGSLTSYGVQIAAAIAK